MAPNERANVEATNEPTDMLCNDDQCGRQIYRNRFLESETAGDSDERTVVVEYHCRIHGLNPEKIEPVLEANKPAAE